MVIGPTPPGTGVMAPAIFTAFVERDVADQAHLAFFGGGYTVDADIDDGCPRLDPVALYHLRTPHGGDQNIGLAADGRQVGGVRMGDGHRAVGR